MRQVVKISVIIPIYNAEATLEICLKSVLRQTLEEVEIICINDGSSDGSLEILKIYQAQFPHKLQVINQPNKGVWHARQKGIEVSQGIYIAFLDSDDMVSPYWLEKLYEQAVVTEADVTVCGYERIEGGKSNISYIEMTQFGKRTFQVKETPDVLVALNTALWNKLFKSQYLKVMPKLEHPPRVLEDVIFLLLLFLDINTVSFVPEALYSYYVRTGTAMMTINEEDLLMVEQGFLEVKKIFEERGAVAQLQTVLAIKAFFHMGASMGYRLPRKDIKVNKKLQKEIRTYLNQNFNNWQKNDMLKLQHILKIAPYNKKLWIIQKVYKYHGIHLFMKCYTKMNGLFKRHVRW